MDNRSGLLIFGIFVLLFAFTFVFGLDSLNIPNVVYGVLAMIGYVVCISGALINGVLMRKDGGALSVWYFAYSIIVSIIFIWYMTRCGTAFGWWT
jgi:branched-subunit amino acid transport protein